MERIEGDTLMEVEYYRIEDFETVKSPFEGHYLHSEVKVSVHRAMMDVRAGDYWISTDQDAVRYIVETLEPQAPDSYFAWNFFDGILMRKEYFSPYVFEDLAARLIEGDEELRTGLKQFLEENPEAKGDGYRQLEWVYKNSKHYEGTHRRYPVYRIR